jgi:single-stranded-DNA-specific exonuclease
LLRSRAVSDNSRHRTFLGIERSLTGRRWYERLDAAGSNVALAIAQHHGLPDLVARVLAGRDVTVEDAPAFLHPTIKSLMPDPSILTDMDGLAERIADAIVCGEAVAIFGDYDVDGATSAALLSRFLRGQGLDPKIYIPDRLFEGYGPNPDAIRSLATAGSRLIVAVDCGTSSTEALETARDLGVDVVVIDHHQAGVDLPPAAALVNPNRQDDLSGLGYLCAVGLTFLAVVSVNRALRRRKWYGPDRPEPDLLQWLDLVALGTVCDVVPLVGLNRAFVAKGLKALAYRTNPGLSALVDNSRLTGDLTPYHLGFVVGPRINAGGRIGDAGLGARLLTSEDIGECQGIAAELERLNHERQAIEAAMLEEAAAEALAEIGTGDGPPVLICGSERWHVGVVGLIAARLKERFNRPAIAIAFQANGLGSGSGRSVAGVDLGRAVRGALERGIVVKGGGHAMAAGLTIERARLGDLRAFLLETLGPAVEESRGNHGLAIDAALTARSANIDMIELLERAGPFGAGHPEPVFVFPAHRIDYIEATDHGHVRFSIATGEGSRLKSIAFRAADGPLGQALLSARGRPLHLAGALSIDQWRAQRRPCLRLIDAATPAPSTL